MDYDVDSTKVSIARGNVTLTLDSEGLNQMTLTELREMFDSLCRAAGYILPYEEEE